MTSTQNDRKTTTKGPQETDPLADLLANFDDVDLDAILADLEVDLDALLDGWTSEDLDALLGGCG